jgi:hypothetical protein
VWLINVLDATLLMPSTGPGGYTQADIDDPGFFASVGSERTEFGYHLRF